MIKLKALTKTKFVANMSYKITQLSEHATRKFTSFDAPSAAVGKGPCSPELATDGTHWSVARGTARYPTPPPHAVRDPTTRLAVRGTAQTRPFRTGGRGGRNRGVVTEPSQP